MIGPHSGTLALTGSVPESGFVLSRQSPGGGESRRRRSSSGASGVPCRARASREEHSPNRHTENRTTGEGRSHEVTEGRSSGRDTHSLVAPSEEPHPFATTSIAIATRCCPFSRAVDSSSEGAATALEVRAWSWLPGHPRSEVASPSRTSRMLPDPTGSRTESSCLLPADVVRSRSDFSADAPTGGASTVRAPVSELTENPTAAPTALIGA